MNYLEALTDSKVDMGDSIGFFFEDPISMEYMVCKINRKILIEDASFPRSTSSHFVRSQTLFRRMP